MSKADDDKYDYTNMEQPDKCLHGYAESCCYPIDDCKNCPARPDSDDWYWGMTGCEIK